MPSKRFEFEHKTAARQFVSINQRMRAQKITGNPNHSTTMRARIACACAYISDNTFNCWPIQCARGAKTASRIFGFRVRYLGHIPGRNRFECQSSTPALAHVGREIIHHRAARIRHADAESASSRRSSIDTPSRARASIYKY